VPGLFFFPPAISGRRFWFFGKGGTNSNS